MTAEKAVESATKSKILTYSSIATSGGSLVLLVTALQVLGQHGDELNMLRNELADLRADIHERNISWERYQTEISSMRLEMERDMKVLGQRIDALDRNWVKLYYNTSKDREE